MNKKIHIEKDVFTAAKERVKNTLLEYDDCACAFSGGKDSLVTINLVDAVRKEMGLQGKTKVFFRDEELISGNVIEFVKSIAESGRFDFRYFAIPLESTKVLLGKPTSYVQWDCNRQHLRQPPDYAIKAEPYRVFSQYNADDFIAQGMNGRVAFFLGIRAQESLNRLQMLLKKKSSRNYVFPQTKRVSTVCPIYDWTEDDVFLYFYKEKVPYCEIYDNQMLNFEGLRVATPFIAESAAHFNKIRTRDPIYYQQLVDLFPEMLVQERYFAEYDKSTSGVDFGKYSRDAKGIYAFIDDVLDDQHQKDVAKKKALAAISARETRLKTNPESIKNLGGYPLLYIMESVLNGSYKRYIKACLMPTDKHFEYEGVDKNAL
ncbi:phosphoadenosine phosphosulfate sulfurtransferase [Clostridia bacterium]|nr:phosphoadenosine phosphosulfate sulfurtransferase [Clostridia bacterium]